MIPATTLAEWERLASAATPGPWDWDAGDIGNEYSAPYCGVFVANDEDTLIYELRANSKRAKDDAAFIAAARQALPELIAEVLALRKALSASRGYLLNAKIDLETGAPKRTAINTIEGGLKMVREALGEQP